MVELTPPRFEGAFRLRAGRELGCAEVGPTTARQILWFHGTPGACRQIARETREACWRRDVRLIAVERSGIGASTPHAYAAAVEFAHDVEQLTQALGIERFAVVGLSGGGPYPFACAHEMPDRVAAVAVLGGVAPSVGPEAPAGGAFGHSRSGASPKPGLSRPGALTGAGASRRGLPRPEAFGEGGG